MRILFILLHLALASTAMLPMYDSSFLFPVNLENAPLGQLLRVPSGHPHLSVVAAGLPAFLAVINLPLLLLRRKPGDAWPAISSIAVGLVSICVLFHLSHRYGYDRLWGVDAAFACAVLVVVSGTVALGRKPASHAQTETDGDPWAPVAESAIDS